MLKSPKDKSEKSIRYKLNEFKLVQNLNNHPHIIDYKYFVREKVLDSTGSEYIQDDYLIMERMDGGDLK